MKKLSIYGVVILILASSLLSCKKFNNDINGAANNTTAGLSTSSLSNRIVAGFVVDSATLPLLPVGSLPSSYNKLRKFLTYDTISTANKPPAYAAGDVISIVGYLRGDDSAIAKRKINVSLYKAPTAFITPANPPTVINVMQNAEDRYRSYQPGAIGSATAPDTLFTLPAIVANTAPLNVTKAYTESIGGINYNTYLVKLSFTVPTAYAGKFTPGTVFSINLNAGTAAGDLGNVNWIYGFRIK